MTLPLSGVSNPAAIFNVSVFPVPVSPSRISVSRSCTWNVTPRKTGPSSNPIHTSSNVTAGSNPAPSFVGVLMKLVRDYSGKSAARRKGNAPGHSNGRALASEDFVGEIQRKFRQKRIRHDDQHRSHHCRGRRGASHALRAPAHRQNSIALKRNEKTDAAHPPSSPTKSMSAVNNGSTSSAASRRGATSLRL